MRIGKRIGEVAETRGSGKGSVGRVGIACNEAHPGADIGVDCRRPDLRARPDPQIRCAGRNDVFALSPSGSCARTALRVAREIDVVQIAVERRLQVEAIKWDLVGRAQVQSDVYESGEAVATALAAGMTRELFIQP